MKYYTIPFVAELLPNFFLPLKQSKGNIRKLSSCSRKTVKLESPRNYKTITRKFLKK